MRKIRLFLKNYIPSIYFPIRKVIESLKRIVLLFNKEKYYSALLCEIFTRFNDVSGSYISDHIDVKNLNTNSIDDQIEDIVLKFYKKNKISFNSNTNYNKNDKLKIGIIFTELYANGGHTPLVERFHESFYKDYNLKLFCTRLESVKHGNYSKRRPNLTSKAEIEGVNWNFRKCNFLKMIIELYNKIIAFKADILFCYIHPNDIIIASVLALIKNNTNIKIININIQDHFNNLGFKFAHLILDARPAGQEITKNIKGYSNTILMPFQQKRIGETLYYTEIEKNNLRQKLNIHDSNYFTLTGTSYYKIFQKNGSEYLEMIRDLLLIEPKLKHVLMTELLPENKIVLNKIFNENQDLLKRLIIIDRVPDFDIYMQTCDLFIDSFPQGGALIHTDMMRNKKPTVLKINSQNLIRSFEYYLPKNYKYQYSDIEDMKKGILTLLYSKDEREKASKELYNYYVNNYSLEVVKNKYKEIIDGRDCLEQFFGRNFYEN